MFNAAWHPAEHVWRPASAPGVTCVMHVCTGVTPPGGMLLVRVRAAAGGPIEPWRPRMADLIYGKKLDGISSCML